MRFRPRAPGHHRLAAAVAATLGIACMAGLGARELTIKNASAASRDVSACDRVPLAKCFPSPTTARNVGPQPIAPVAAEWQSPESIPCGSTFFSTSQASELTANFGLLSCFRFQGSQTWVVVGSGTPATGAAVAPGGTMIATATCGASDSVCLDANAEHSFDTFTVSYPPKPDSTGSIEATFGSRLLYFSDAYCGLFVFDLASDTWYEPSSVSNLMTGLSAVTSGPTPHALTGTSALSRPAPSSTGACQ